MAINPVLFKAILAMDAYNRGYGAGIAGLGGVGTRIGSATIYDDKGDAEAQASGFYGIAYELEGSQAPLQSAMLQFCKRLGRGRGRATGVLCQAGQWRPAR